MQGLEDEEHGVEDIHAQVLPSDDGVGVGEGGVQDPEGVDHLGGGGREGGRGAGSSSESSDRLRSHKLSTQPNTSSPPSLPPSLPPSPVVSQKMSRQSKRKADPSPIEPRDELARCS